MRESMRFCHMVHSMKRIEIPLIHIRDKNKFKDETLYFLWFNISKLFLLHCLFNVLRLLFISFGSMFQDFQPFNDTYIRQTL